VNEAEDISNPQLIHDSVRTAAFCAANEAAEARFPSNYDCGNRCSDHFISSSRILQAPPTGDPAKTRDLGSSMKTKLEYGDTGLEIEIPNSFRCTEIRTRSSTPLADPAGYLKKLCLAPGSGEPLDVLASRAESACIVVPDHTRPVPSGKLLPPILDAVEAGGVRKDRITVLIGTGMHRPSTPAEREWMFGAEIESRVKVVCHDHRRTGDLTRIGTLDDGTEILVNRILADADLGISVSLVEPHLMAGFSGGGKAVCPRVIGLETLKALHAPPIIDHPLSREGVAAGNILQENAVEIARDSGVRFAVNVTLDPERRLTGIFAGEIEQSRREAIEQVRKQSLHHLDKKYQAVLTTGAGRPLDATLYQSFKGAHGALQVIEDGGIILLAAECGEGLGSDNFISLLEMQKDPGEFLSLLRSPGFFRADQWMAQHLAVIRLKANLLLFSTGLRAEDRAKLPFTVLDSIKEGFKIMTEQIGPNPSLLVVPEGCYVLPMSE